MESAASPADADPSLDRLARIIQEALDIPIAMISIVDSGQQLLAGSAGLPEPWSSTRGVALDISLCAAVVALQAPLVIEDVRIDSRTADDSGVLDLGMLAYAGFPLRDAAGVVIGSVCALDVEPRVWLPSDLMLLSDLTDVASAELELRTSRLALVRSVKLATELSARARLLLSLSESLADTVTATDVACALHDVATKHLNCVHAGIWIADPEDVTALRYVDHPLIGWPQAERYRVVATDLDTPVGETVITRRPLFFPDHDVRDARFAGTVDSVREGEGEGRAVVPLVLGTRTLGALVLVWEHARDFSDDDRLTISALTSYAAQAVHRAGLLAERTSVARTLQAALLTDSLPQPEHFGLAARYVAVAEMDEAGGDWFDAHVHTAGCLHVTIGDVQGHDIRSAAVMGALRNMLRTLDWALDESPADILFRLDQAAVDFEVARHATVLFGRLERDAATGDSTFEWSSAGHLPPLVVRPDGTCLILDDDERNDTMLLVQPERVRRNRRAIIPAGSTLLLYTDGLVETREQDVDAGIERVRQSLIRWHDLEPDPLVDALLLETTGSGAEDDVALLAVRLR